MHTVALRDQAIAAAIALGYRIRQEWLEGSGGECEIRGQKWLFIDLSLSAGEQLEQVIEAIQGDPRLATLDSPEIPAWLKRLGHSQPASKTEAATCPACLGLSSSPDLPEQPGQRAA